MTLSHPSDVPLPSCSTSSGTAAAGTAAAATATSHSHKKLWLLHPAGSPDPQVFETFPELRPHKGLLAWASNQMIDALSYFQEGANHNGDLICILGARYVLRECPNLLATPQDRDVDRELLQRAINCSLTKQAAAFEDLQLLATVANEGSLRNICLFLQGVIAEHMQHSFQNAIQYYRQAALGGNIPAAFNLGLLLVKDHSNPALGYSLIEKAMQKRYPSAMHNCAVLYAIANENEAPMTDRTREVPQKLYVASAACGNPESMFALGKWCEHSDPDAAMHYFHAAAYRGHREAQYEIAKAVVSSNVTSALKYYRLSAEQGHKDACFHLGGLMIRQNMDAVEAQQWITIAASLGSTQAAAFCLAN